MGGEHPVLAVNRHHVPRPEEREHRPQLLLVRVPGDVHRGDLLVQHLRTRARELVDRVVDAKLVSRNRLGGDDDRVALCHLERRVVAVGDSGQRRQRLALAPGAEREHVAGRKQRGLVRTHERVLGNVDVA